MDAQPQQHRDKAQKRTRLIARIICGTAWTLYLNQNGYGWLLGKHKSFFQVGSNCQAVGRVDFEGTITQTPRL